MKKLITIFLICLTQYSIGQVVPQRITVLNSGGGSGTNKVDSATTSNDSLYYWINGSKHFGGLVGSGGSVTMSAGTGVTITGTGTSIDPYVINATGGGSGNGRFIIPEYGIIADSSIANQYKIRVDSATLRDIHYLKKPIYADGDTTKFDYTVTDSLHVQDSIAIITKENSLGNPSTNGYVLSSTTGGERIWVPQSGGGAAKIYVQQVGAVGDSLIYVKNDSSLLSARIRDSVGIISGYASDGAYYFKADTGYLKTVLGGSSLTTNQIAFGSGTNKITSDSALQFNATGMPISGTYNTRGLELRPRLNGTANGSILAAFSIQPYYSSSIYTGVIKEALKINNSYLNIDSNSVFSVNDGEVNLPVSNSNVLGAGAGVATSNLTTDANIFGKYAGRGASAVYYSNFLGTQAGDGATNADRSNFIGRLAGLNATGANQSNFFGQSAGSGATNAFASNFFGFNAGSNATAASYSNFFGWDVGYSPSTPITGVNNILIGTCITLPTQSSSNMMSLGNVLYGTNFNNLTATPVSAPMINGHIGINNAFPDSSAALDITGYKYGILIPRMTTANRLSITSGVALRSTISAGSGYTNGTYTGVTFTGGTGSGFTANVVVSGGVPSSIIPTYSGYNYSVGDTLTAASFGGSSGLKTKVTALQLAAKTLMVMDTTLGKLFTYNVFWKPEGGLSGSFSGSASSTTTFTVTIGTTLPNTSYKIQVTPTASIGAAPFFVNNKTTTTFDVVYVSGITGTETFDWYLSY